MAVRARVDAARKYLEATRLCGDTSSASHPRAEWLHHAAVEQESGRRVTAVAGSCVRLRGSQPCRRTGSLSGCQSPPGLLPDQPFVPRETCSCALTSRQFRAGRFAMVRSPAAATKVESRRSELDAYAVNQRANPSIVVPMPIRSRGSCHNPEVVSNSLATRTSRTPPTYP